MEGHAATFDQQKLLTTLRKVLEIIHEKNLFQDERGYQGALIQELSKHLVDASLPGDPIIQEEYQKTLPHHGIRIRPDIIIHIPFERGKTAQRKEGNFVAIELKRRAGKRKAQDAFANLVELRNSLRYPLTIFINIDSNQTHFALCPRSIATQTICFAVRLEEGRPVVLCDSTGNWQDDAN